MDFFKKWLAKIKSNPTWWYALSICATWAGAGSYISGVKFLKTGGWTTFILWALGNSLCCVFFGVMTWKFKFLRKIFTSKIYKWILFFFTAFNVWINMSALQENLPFGNWASLILVYIIGLAFLVYFVFGGVMRNVITDSCGWIWVYLIVLLIGVVSICVNGIAPPEAGFTASAIGTGLKRCATLLIGGFYYPFFWELLDYNDKNDERTRKVNIMKSFCLGGMLFGCYLVCLISVGVTEIVPILKPLQGLCICLIGLSSYTSFIFSFLAMYGKRKGLILNLGCFATFLLVQKWGAFKIWSVMQDLRFACLVVSIAVYLLYVYVIRKRAK